MKCLYLLSKSDGVIRAVGEGSVNASPGNRY